jgi:hypothetical protein
MSQRGGRNRKRPSRYADGISDDEQPGASDATGIAVRRRRQSTSQMDDSSFEPSADEYALYREMSAVFNYT